MPEPFRADEAGQLHHALNRGHLRSEMLRKDEDMGRMGGTHTMRSHAQ